MVMSSWVDLTNTRTFIQPIKSTSESRKRIRPSPLSSSRNSPKRPISCIELDDNEDLQTTKQAKLWRPGSRRISGFTAASSQLRPIMSGLGTEVIDLEACVEFMETNSGSEDGQSGSVHFSPDDYLTDDEVAILLQGFNIENHTQLPSHRVPARKPPPGEKISSVRFNDCFLSEGKSVELKDGTFLRIENLYRTEAGDVLLHGRHLIRQNSLESMMPKHINELVWSIVLTADQHKFGVPAEPKEVTLSEVRRLRQVVFTNRPFGVMCARDEMCRYRDGQHRVNEGPLFCRWKWTTVSLSRRQTSEARISVLSPDECDLKARHRTLSPREDPATLRFRWRGTTRPGGSLDNVQRSLTLRGESEDQINRQYTLGDAFCGLGGATQGAVMAGLAVAWGFDKDIDAANSYRANFERRGTITYELSVDQFLRLPNDVPLRVDVLHISPPCQPYSPANTTPNEEKNAENQAPLFAVADLLRKVKPRIVTMEETAGLLRSHPMFFKSLIRQFISEGYSVGWTILRCEEFGVPQTRKRLCITAAGPGENLPRFPRPTHGGPGTGRKPRVTINDKIKDIPTTASHHDTNIEFKTGPRIRFSGNTLAKTVTCNLGVGNYHPTGRRTYTVREAACLQTLPTMHMIATPCRTKAIRQVGNAVPPSLARAIFREVIESLKKTDGVAPWRQGGTLEIGRRTEQVG